jgi:2-C-methyl-D-erythritol 2,4-cyclodiphosphate synthase
LTSLRIGHGYDAHQLVAGRPLLLGGVEIDAERGLLGHSDGDCVLHAACDAILGAMAAGDMGDRFPSSDARFEGIASRVFIEETLRLARERGFVIVNIDVTVVAQEPRLAPHLPRLRIALAGLLGLGPDQVSVKAKSPDHMGAIGRAEGIAALATVLLEHTKGTG